MRLDWASDGSPEGRDVDDVVAHVRSTERKGAMHAEIGDRLVVKGHAVSEPDRDGKITEIHGENGEPPYLVEWSDDGHIGLVFPGPDARVDHLGENNTSK